MRELFIYYRVRSTDAGAAQVAARQMQARLCAGYPVLIAGLLRRANEENGVQTWMETYSTITMGDGVTTDMQATIESQALVLQPLIDGLRHTEVFIEIAA
jgi:hypothetical protein